MTAGPSFSSVLVAIVVVALGARWRPARHRVPGRDDQSDQRTADEGARRRRRTRSPRSGPHRRSDSLDSDAASTLERISRDVRSGTSLSAAASAALASQPHLLRELRSALHRGTPLPTALAAPRDALSPAETVMRQALQVSVATGGPIADTLDRGAAILRERHAWAEERRAQSAQARLSALVLTSVPVGFAALGVASSARVRAAYTDVPITLPITACGVLLNLAGWWWMQRLVHGAAA